MGALFRNPLLRLSVRLWWLPALALAVIALGPLGANNLGVFKAGMAIYLAVITGLIGAAWVHGTAAALGEWARHTFKRHRFLCPHCLHLQSDGLRFACARCGEPVESFLIHTKGLYVNDCSNCGQPLFSRGGFQDREALAHCDQCCENCDRAIHHERQVRVMAALRATDFASLCQAVNARPHSSRDGVGTVCGDDGDQLTYVLDFSSVKDASLLATEHAVWDAQSVWIDGGDDDPEKLALEVGQAADRFVRETKRQKLTAYVRQAVVPPAVRRVLESRFETIRFEMTAEGLLFRSARVSATSERSLASEVTAYVADEINPQPEANAEQLE
jgi:hypothetical protein